MDEPLEILLEAIDRNAPIELILTISGITQAFKSRLLSQYDKTIWLESVAGHEATIDALIASGEPLEISLRSDRMKIEFAVPIKERRRAFRVNESIYVPALGVTFPEKLHSTQRRSSYRVPVVPDSCVKFKAWVLEPGADCQAEPDRSSELCIDVRDFSTGGIGGTWKRRRTGPETIVAGQRLRVLAERDHERLILEGRIAFTVPLPDPDFKKLGVQFMLDSTILEDRNKMIEIGSLIIAMQHEELRRTKVAR